MNIGYARVSTGLQNLDTKQINQVAFHFKETQEIIIAGRSKLSYFYNESNEVKETI